MGNPAGAFAENHRRRPYRGMSNTLAIKYRPRTLKGVIGQAQSKRILKTVLEQAHKMDIPPAAFLITGDTGTGKTTLARIIGKYLNCESGNGCGKCSSCLIFNDNPDSHPDYREINAADTRGIDDIRAMVTASWYSSLTGRVRVFVLDEAHNLTPQAAQALHTPLEKTNATYILATTNPEMLPQSIHDRCIKLALKPVATKTLARRLARIAERENINLDSKYAMRMARRSGGMVRRAIAALETLNAAGNISFKSIDAYFDS